MSCSERFLSKKETLGGFIAGSAFFRQSNIEPTSEAIQEGFGSYSHLFNHRVAALRHAWATRRRHGKPRLVFETWQKYLTTIYGQLGDAARHPIQMLVYHFKSGDNNSFKNFLFCDGKGLEGSPDPDRRSPNIKSKSLSPIRAFYTPVVYGF